MRTNEEWVVAAVALFETIMLFSPEVTDYSIQCQPVAKLSSAFRFYRDETGQLVEYVLILALVSLG